MDSLDVGDDISGEICLYTDGSKTTYGTGYGGVLYDEDGNLLDTVSGAINMECSIFQAESYAITKSLELLRHIDQGNTVNIVLTDVQATNGVIHVLDAVILPQL